MVRRVVLWSSAIVLALVAAVTGVASLVVWQAAPWSVGDRLQLIGIVLTASTVLLALIAGLVAIAAYAAATPQPNLVAHIQFRFSDVDDPVLLLADLSDLPWARMVEQFRQCEAVVTIENRSGHSARNPALRIDFVGWGGIGVPAGWTEVASANQIGPISIQWDGGADYAVHGNWTRVLPQLDFAGVRVPSVQNVELVFTLVADGFRSVRRIPVRLLERDAYDKYSKERAARVMSAQSTR